MDTTNIRKNQVYIMVEDRVGFEPTVGFRQWIKSPSLSTISVTGPKQGMVCRVGIEPTYDRD